MKYFTSFNSIDNRYGCTITLTDDNRYVTYHFYLGNVQSTYRTLFLMSDLFLYPDVI